MQPIERKFQKFIPGENKPVHERIYVSISDRNRIALNERCYRELGKPPAVYLYYSPEDQMIAIEPVQSARLPGTFELRRHGSATWHINASPFCSHHNIRLNCTERFIYPEFRNGRLYLMLNQTLTIRKARRKRGPG